MTTVANTAKQATSTMNAIINTGGTLVRLLGWLAIPTPIAAASVKVPTNPVNIRPASLPPLRGGTRMDDFRGMEQYEYDVDNMMLAP